MNPFDLTAAQLNLLITAGEVLVFVAGAVTAGLYKGRRTATTDAQAARDKAYAEEEASRQQVIANFQALVATFKDRLEAVTQQVESLSTELAVERAKSAAQLQAFVGFVRRSLARHPNDAMDQDDIDALTTLGVEVVARPGGKP